MMLAPVQGRHKPHHGRTPRSLQPAAILLSFRPLGDRSAPPVGLIWPSLFARGRAGERHHKRIHINEFVQSVSASVELDGTLAERPGPGLDRVVQSASFRT